MTLLRADELLSSAVVANSTMNRGRGLSGVNSYERDLRFAILPFLAARVREQGSAFWYDACCGQGRALEEAGRQIAAAEWGGGVEIVGADLVEMFTPEPAPGVSLIAADVGEFWPSGPADLITCVHGLHYLGGQAGLSGKSPRDACAGRAISGAPGPEERSACGKRRVGVAAGGAAGSYKWRGGGVEKSHSAF